MTYKPVDIPRVIPLPPIPTSLPPELRQYLLDFTGQLNKSQANLYDTFGKLLGGEQTFNTPKAEDTFTPTADADLVTKSYVDDNAGFNANFFVVASGATMSTVTSGTTITFGTVVHNKGSAFGSSVFTATEAGIYIVTFYADFLAGATTDIVGANIVYTGHDSKTFHYYASAILSSDWTYKAATGTCIRDMDVGDTLKITAYTNLTTIASILNQKFYLVGPLGTAS